ncbi:MAG TPA: zinc ribbon domain-containing protein, partial [Vicinamibacteria bacterium]
AVLAAAPASGQAETTSLEDLKIDLWPEYDRPSTLVMYRFRLKPGASPSDPVAVPIPSNVGDPHAVAWRDGKGSLFVAQFTRRVEKDRTMVLARLGSREGQLEFYANIDVADRKRSFRFVWPGGVEVGSLSFQVQRPKGAAGFRVLPAPNREWEGEDGLGYALVELGPQTPSSTPSVEIGYEKESAALTAAERPPPPPEAPRSAPAVSETREEPASPVPWWLLAAGGALLVLVGAAVLFTRRDASAPAPRREKPSEPPADGANPIFCHECGTKCRRTDTFCMNCGTRLAEKRD